MKPTTFAVLALTFITAFQAAAQVVGTDEQAYGPFASGPGGASMALAVAPHGMLLVWTEIDPGATQALVHTGLLDFDGRLVGAIHTIPTRRGDHHASQPAVTTDGERFFVAWVERDPYRFTPRAVSGVLTGPDGVPAGAVRPFGRAVDGSPAVIWDGLTFRLFGDESYTITPEGTVTSKHGDAARRVPFATPQANGWVSWNNTTTVRYICFFHCSGPRPWYELRWAVLTAEGTRTGRLFEDGYISEAPAVVASGTDLLVVWTTDTGLAALPIHAGEAKRVFLTRLPAEGVPSMAGPLVVFEWKGDVFGSVVAGGAFGPPFAISTSGAWDTQPRVFPAGPNRYLVTYVREHAPSSATLAGRFVTLDP